MARQDRRHHRVFIRPPADSDEREFLTLMRASRSFHQGWVKPPATPAAFRQWLERLRSERHIGFLVCRREDKAIAGVINLNEIIRGPAQSVFLGYYVGSRFAAQGYMTEGLELVLRHAFMRLRLHRLEANIQPDNRRSIDLIKRCGFTKEGYSPRYLKISGRWRDHERWALLSEDWRKRHKGTNRNQRRTRSR